MLKHWVGYKKLQGYQRKDVERLAVIAIISDIEKLIGVHSSPYWF